jgi:hypothetical protein
MGARPLRASGNLLRDCAECGACLPERPISCRNLPKADRLVPF